MARLPVLSLLVVIAACLFAPLAWSQGGGAPGGPPMTRAEHMAKLKAEREQRMADARKRSEAARAEQRRVDAEEEANAQKELEESNKRWEEMRARNAEQIRKFDEAIEDWRETADKPPGTVEDFVSSSYNEETALGESARIVFYNRQDVPTHQVEFGPDGKPTGPITITQQGKAWETIGPQLKDGAQWEPVYGRSPEGDITIVSADIIKDGRTVSRFHFNEEGVPWKGENWRYDGVPRGDPGINSGGFYDPRLEPKPDTLGKGFDVPASHRLITGVCPECREKADRYNDLAGRANRLLADMRVQSEEHKHSHRAAQIPIEQRYAHLKAELDALTPELEAAKAAALECEKICRPPTSKLPPPDLTRPSLIPIAKLEPPASFCDEFARVAYMNEVYTPAAKAGLANAQTASAHLGKLGGMFTHYMKNEGGPGWAAVREEQAAYGPIAETATKDSNAINAMYQRILAIPIVPCPDQKPRVATGDTTPPPPAVPPTDDVGVIPARAIEQATGGKKPCPPKTPRKPIVVGPNSKVGSGAQLSKKLGGMLVGGLLGAAGVPGGGGGGGGPQLYKCTLKDSKLTLFKHPSGLTLGIGAQRGKGDNVLITADIQKSPDKGTFQAALLEKPGTQQLQPPSEVGPCDLWGDWQLTVSWTKTTYVNGQKVSEEHGGWSEGGKFTLPGQLSKVDNADALWKRMGFSSASHGAQKAIMAFKVPPGGSPLTFTTWITQPKGDPVMAVPITVTMTETTPGVFTFTEGEADCPYGFDTVSTTRTPPASSGPVATTPAVTTPPAMPPNDPYLGMPRKQIMAELPYDLAALRGYIDVGDADPCGSGYEDATRKLAELRAGIAKARGGDPLGDVDRQALDEMSARLDQIEAELAAKKAAQAAKPCPKAASTPVSTADAPPPPESILDDLEDEGTKANPAFGSRPADPVPPKTPPGVSEAQARDNDSAVSNVAINELIRSYQTIDQFNESQLQENPCDEALRARVLAELRSRLAMIDDPKAPPDARSAALDSRERTQALIDRIEKPSEQCTESFDPPHKPMTTPTFDPAPAPYTDADEPTQPPPAPFDENPAATARKELETQADDILREFIAEDKGWHVGEGEWDCGGPSRFHYIQHLQWEYEQPAKPGALGQLVWERRQAWIRQRLAEVLKEQGDCGKTVDALLKPPAAERPGDRPGPDPATVEAGAHTRDPWMGDGPPPAPFDENPAATARKKELEAQADDIAKTFDEDDKGWHVGEGEWDCGGPSRFHYIQHLQNEYGRGPDPGELGQLVWERKQAWVRKRLTEVLKEQGDCGKTVDGILNEVEPFPSAKTAAAAAEAASPPAVAKPAASTDEALRAAQTMADGSPDRPTDNLEQTRRDVANRSLEEYFDQQLFHATEACKSGTGTLQDWLQKRDQVLRGYSARLSNVLNTRPTGRNAGDIQSVLDQEKVRLVEAYDDLSKQTPPVCAPLKPGAAPPAPPPPKPDVEDILGDIDEVFVPA